MDKIKIERTWLQGSPVQVDNLMGNAFVGEAGAHEFLISGKDNAGNVVPITGSISGKFLSSTMTTFALSGYVTEGVASVTLPSECYGAPGQFVISIFATNGSTTTCIYCGVGSIFRTSTAAIAYPTTTLPDLTLLINQLDDVIASFPADLTHLLGAIAPTFVDNQPFTAGQYVWYNQVLYRFTADHPAGSWAGSADTVVAVIGTELNSTVRYTQQVLTDAQKTVARSNIDAADADDVTDLELTTVQVTPQTFDDNSKSQARSNIGAASSGDLSTLSGLVIQQGGYITDLKSAIDVLEPTATAEDEGKALIVKTVTSGKVSEYEFGTAGEGLTEAAKVALLNCFAHVAWIDEHGQDYYDALKIALYPETDLVSMTAVFTQGSFVIYPSTPLNDLKAFLTVTGYYNDGRTRPVTDYALSGTLAVGTSTITVSKDGVTTTFTVAVSAPYWDYEWDASSNTPPAEMLSESYDFTTDPNAMRVISPRLDLDYIGAAEFEVTIKPFYLAYNESDGQYVEYKYSQLNFNNNNPQLALIYSNSGDTKTGARVIFSSYRNNVMCTRLFTGGNEVDISNDDYHSFRIVVGSGTAKIYVDDVLTGDGQGASSQYYEYSGITCSINTQAEHPNKYGAYIKSIKFKRL